MCPENGQLKSFCLWQERKGIFLLMILQSHPEWQMGNIVMAIFVPLEEGYSLELPYPVTPLPLPQKEANISKLLVFPHVRAGSGCS